MVYMGASQGISVDIRSPSVIESRIELNISLSDFILVIISLGPADCVLSIHV